jgi:hypothetical protein
MCELIKNIGVNIISDIIFLVMALLIGWGIYYYTRRHKLFKFFKISDTKRLIIYLSNLRITKGGALGIAGSPASYQGSTIVYNELIASYKFRDNFNYIAPSLSDKPGLLSKLLISDVNVRSQISVLHNDHIDHSTSIITLGSPTYNLVSRHVEQHQKNIVRFKQDQNSSFIEVDNIQPIRDTDYGFIERIFDRNNNRNMFYAAGLSELGTVGAADYLAHNWNSLHKKYKGDKNFLIMLRFSPQNMNNWTIVFEKEWD